MSFLQHITVRPPPGIKEQIEQNSFSRLSSGKNDTENGRN